MGVGVLDVHCHVFRGPTRMHFQVLKLVGWETPANHHSWPCVSRRGPLKCMRFWWETHMSHCDGLSVTGGPAAPGSHKLTS